MDKTPIYIAGYPKSGTTFATRLIGDALNSPTGGSIPKLDKTEPATEGKNRPGKWIVRKGHYVIRNDQRNHKTVPYAHVINMNALKEDERVICVFRDPRDIAVSGAAYWNMIPEDFLHDMHRGIRHCRLCGNWSEYIRRWITYCKNDSRVIGVDYFELVEMPFDTLCYIYEWLGLEIGEIQKARIGLAINRNSFQNTKRRIQKRGDKMPLGKHQNLKLVRKGIVGDWRNHLDQNTNNMVWDWFGREMKALQYQRM